MKYDGYRALCALSNRRVARRTRNKLDLASRFPDAARALSQVVVGDELLGSVLSSAPPSLVGRRKGSASGSLGSLLLAVADGKGDYEYAGKVGTGFTAKERLEPMRELSRDEVDRNKQGVRLSACSAALRGRGGP